MNDKAKLTTLFDKYFVAKLENLSVKARIHIREIVLKRSQSNK